MIMGFYGAMSAGYRRIFMYVPLIFLQVEHYFVIGEKKRICVILNPKLIISTLVTD